MGVNPSCPVVVSVSNEEDHTLLVAIESGEKGLLDMKPYLDFGIFRKIRNQKVFETVRVSFGTIAWESGADLDPEFVYEKCRIT